MRELERVVGFLGVDSRTSYRDAIESLQLRPAPGKWQSDWGNEQLACVLDEVQPMLHELGYTP